MSEYLQSHGTQEAPLSVGFLKQEYWSVLPFPFPGDIPHPRTETLSAAWQANLYHWDTREIPIIGICSCNSVKSLYLSICTHTHTSKRCLLNNQYLTNRYDFSVLPHSFYYQPFWSCSEYLLNVFVGSLFLHKAAFYNLITFEWK